MNRSAAALVAILVLAAGCAGAPESPPPETPAASTGTSVVETADPGAAPVWALGDWWTYSIEYPNSGDSDTTTVVVYKEDGGNWYLATDTRQGGELAEFSHYPILGPWTKAGVQPTIHSALIPFFKFPLSDGKTWTDPYRGTPASWKAVKAGNVFELEVVIEDGQTVTYGYDRAVGFLTHLEYGFGGTPNTIMNLLRNGDNYTGSVSVLTFIEHVHGAYAVVTPPAAAPPSSDVPPTATDFTVGDAQFLLWGFFYGGAPGAYEFTLNPREGSETEGVEHHQQTTDAASRFLWGEIADPRTGSWGLLAAGVSNGPGFVFAEALEVNEETVSFG
ncbi:MAG TPA: hypothetical protein VGB18_07450 [Candidatus Thermoplasmatota archaeon]